MFNTSKVKEIVDNFIINKETPNKVFLINGIRVHLELDYDIENARSLCLLVNSGYELFTREDDDSWEYSVYLAEAA